MCLYETERQEEEVEGTDDDDEWIHRNPGTVCFWSSAMEAIVNDMEVVV